MNAWRVLSILLCLCGAGILVGCGTIGPAVAPESIGVNVKRQKDLEERERLRKEALQREEDGRKVPPVPDEAGGQLTEAEQQQAEGILPEKITNPSARPSGDVLTRPR